MVGVCGSIARAVTGRLGSPALTALQLSPPSVLLKTPLLYVPAYRVAGAWGSIARAAIKMMPGAVVAHALTPPPPRVRLTTARRAAAIRAVQVPVRPIGTGRASVRERAEF